MDWKTGVEWLDPKAPADDPRHPGTARPTAEQLANVEQLINADEARRDGARWAFLLGQGHQTDLEEQAEEVADLEEMERRSALVADLRAGTIEEARITDLTGAEYRWNLDLEAWEPVTAEPIEGPEPTGPEPAKKAPARKSRRRGPATQEEDPQKALEAALAKLDGNKGKG